MKPWPVWALLAGCLAVSGCRTDPNIVLLERELRWQEDRIYQLEDCVDEYEEMLESCRRELATLRRQLKNQQYSVDAEPVPPGGARLPRAVTEPARRSGTKPPEGTIPIAPPTVDLGQPADELPERFRRPHKPATEHPPGKPESEPPVYRPEPLPNGAGAGYRAADIAGRVAQVPGPMLPGMDEPASDSGEAEGPARSATIPDSRNVASISLNPLLTGGYNKRRRSGSEGVMVVIEPRDADGKLLEAPGEVSVAVIDPALEGPAGRIARWDFSADEIARKFRNTIAGRAIELEMPWPGEPPRNDRLHLFVRYITSDGRKLHADRPIRVNPPLEVLERAEPSDAESQRQPPPPPDVQSGRNDDRWRSAPPGVAQTLLEQTRLPQTPAPSVAVGHVAVGYEAETAVQSVVNAVQSAVNTGQSAVNAGQSVVNAVQSAVNAGQSAVNAGQSAVNDVGDLPVPEGAGTGTHAYSSNSVQPAHLPKLKRPVWTPERR